MKQILYNNIWSAYPTRLVFLLPVVFVCIFFITSCLDIGRHEKFPKTEPFESQDFAMGTFVVQRVYGKNAEEATKKVLQRIREIEAKMSINFSKSEINRLNLLSGTGYARLSPETFYVIEEAVKYGNFSKGVFDITVGPLVEVWGISSEAPAVPSFKKIDNILRLIDYRSIMLHRDSLSAKLEKQGQAVDLGGIAKGFAGDETVRIYKENEIESAYVNIGGNVVVSGNKPDNMPWRIGIQNPREENGKYIGIVSVSDRAVVTSGDYQRYFYENGIRYHHIFNPYTGYPADSGLISATVIAESSIEADALSTTLFILGLEEGMKFIEKFNGVEAVFIDKNKKIYITSGLKKNFIFSDESGDYEFVEER